MIDDQVREWLTQDWLLQNEAWRWLSLATAFVVSVLLGWFAKLAFFFASKNAGRRQDRRIAIAFLTACWKSVGLVIVTIGLGIGFHLLKLDAGGRELLDTVVRVLATVSIASFLYHLVAVPDALLSRWTDGPDAKIDAMLVELVRKILKILVLVFAGVQVFHELSGQQITSIIAGLGIGGLAVALAAQDSLKHFFGSIVISGDKPFRIGERIVIDGHDGPVEKVGLRSTHVRTLDGHLVVIPNGELANKTIQNIGRRPFIRRLFHVTITYDTPPDKVEKAVAILNELLDNHEGMKENFPPRVYFNDFNDASLNIIVIYWYHPPAYWDFMAHAQRLNLDILRRFNEEGIDFAFPTQTLYLAGDEKRPLHVGLEPPPPETSRE